MSSKRIYIATFWRSNLQLKNDGYYTTKEFQSVSLQGATNQTQTAMRLLCAAQSNAGILYSSK